MIDIRSLDTLRRTRAEGLSTTHHFYPADGGADRSTWGALRALDHHVLAPMAETKPRPLKDMDVVTIVRDGAIAHRGNLGSVHHTLAGEVQLIRSAPGMIHGSGNPAVRAADFFELRFVSDFGSSDAKRHVAAFPGRHDTGKLVTLASGFAEDREALRLGTRARVMAARVPSRGRVGYALAPGRLAYLVALNGKVIVNGSAVSQFDGAAICDERLLWISAEKFAEILLIDVR